MDRLPDSNRQNQDSASKRPAIPRMAMAPLRTSEIMDLAAYYKERCAGLTIDEVAELSDITLIRMPDANADAGGFAYAEIVKQPKYIESLSRPGEMIRVRGQYEERVVNFIVMNPEYRKGGGAKPVAEDEIFWHEWYHVHYSPSGWDKTSGFVHQFSLANVLETREERRANLFAALMLIDEFKPGETAMELCERCGVSLELASLAIEHLLPKLPPGRLP